LTRSNSWVPPFPRLANCTGFDTIDAPPISSTVTLSDADHSSGLAARLGATRRIEELDVADPAKPWPTIAEALAERHRPGTLTLAVLNTVDSARSLHRELNKSNPEAELVLLHSRFRPADRSAAVSAGLAPISADGPGRIVVSTQVVEAGVDISASTLVTEAAPWPSVVQRAGRCNRDGRDARASFLWYAPRQSAPYPEPDVAAAVDELRSLGGESVTSSDLGSRGVPTTREIHPVLRLVDVLGVWDSLPDLSGNDLDVSRFIRDSDDLDVEVAWREISDHQHPVLDVPGASERCPVPVAELRRFLRQKGRRAWIPDLLDETWQPLSDRDVRPGLVVVLDRQGGGYTTDAGWDPTSRKPVPVVETAPDAVDAEETIDSDTLSYSRWVTLEQHLRDTEDEVRRLTALLNPHGCHPSILEAAAIAGRLHDIGKAHPSFQEMLVATEDEAARPSRLAEGPWAKSKKGRGSLNKRRYFRHELAGALALLDGAGEALHGSAEADLVRYLVAAHHGIVRLGFRPLPNERPLPDGTPVALGVHSGETLPSVSVPGGVLPESRLDLSVMSVGDSGRGPSWSSRTLKLRDRPDLGPFRLGFLEALVRLADWAVSASYEVEGNA
jgi:CRISPR-associated endonuclease/helicase Cas3